MLAEREALRCQEMDRPVKTGTGINQAQVDFCQEEKEIYVILRERRHWDWRPLSQVWPTCKCKSASPSHLSVTDKSDSLWRLFSRPKPEHYWPDACKKKHSGECSEHGSIQCKLSWLFTPVCVHTTHEACQGFTWRNSAGSQTKSLREIEKRVTKYVYITLQKRVKGIFCQFHLEQSA